MNTIPVTVRRRKEDREPELFFYSDDELTCYARMGQHSSASLEYMHDKTFPADPDDSDCAALISEWNSMGGAKARIVHRLMRARKVLTEA